MKKILFILFVITTIVCGQARYTLPDSIVAHRAELNAQDIRVAALESTTSSHTSTLSSHTSSISNLSSAVNAHDDSVDALRDDIQALDDSVAVHLDTLKALRDDVNDVVIGTDYFLLAVDNTVSGDNEFTGESDFTTGEVLIGEKPSVPVANQLTASIDQNESGLWWGASLRMPDIDAVQGLLDLNYTYDLPEVITNGDDTLNFTNDRNFVKSVMTVAADNNLNLYFANSGYGNITILIIGGWNPSGTINWNTTIVGETLKWVGGTEPPLDTSTSDQIFMISFMKVTSTLIIGQWNWAE